MVLPYVEPGTQFTAIAAGGGHNLALRRDGTVVAWGWNEYGQSAVPEGLRDVVAIAAGGWHSLALKADGTVVAWGWNEYGQSAVPEGLRDVVAIAAGALHNLALRRDGTVVAWGRNREGQSTVPWGLSDVVAIAAGGYHSLALRRDGTVVAWGWNEYGQSTVPEGLRDVVAIAAGALHNLALRRDGTVVAWGRNREGQSTVPWGLSDVVAIAAGGYHSLALRRDGTVVAWGGNSWGQSTVPEGLRDVVAIAAGVWHSLALRRDGTVVAWGANRQGQSTVPEGLRDVVAIAAGGAHSLVLRRDGTVVAWGANWSGQTVPSGLRDVVAIAAGGEHSLAIVRGGGQTGYVFGTGVAGLRLRAAPGLSADVLLVIPEGSEVLVLAGQESRDGHLWRQVQYRGRTGWAAARYLVLGLAGEAPAAPTHLRQWKADGVTVLPARSQTEQRTVVLGATVPGTATKAYKAQFEVRRAGENFSGPTHESDWAVGGAAVKVTVKDLGNGGYRWRARTLSAEGRAGEWALFGGGGGAADFTVQYAAVPTASFAFSPGLIFVGDTVRFRAQAAGQAGLTFAWQFSDGQTAQGAEITRVFNSPGPYTVRLVVERAPGLRAERTETISVLETDLRTAINRLVDGTRNFLDSIVTEAENITWVADYFQRDLNATETRMALSVVINGVAAALGKVDFKWWFLQQLSPAEREALREAAIEATSEVVQGWLNKVANEVLAGRKSYTNIFVAPLRVAVGEYKAQLERQRQELLSSSVNLTPEEARILAGELAARGKGNSAALFRYREMVSGPVIELRTKLAYGADFGVEEAVFNASSFYLSVVSGLSTLKAIALAVGSDFAGELANLSVGGRMLASAILLTGEAGPLANKLYQNARDGLERVSSARISSPPTAEITIEDYAEGFVVLFGFQRRFLAVKAYSDVTIRNTGSREAVYRLDQIYMKTRRVGDLFPFRLLSVRRDTYSIPVLVSEPEIWLRPGQSATRRIKYGTWLGELFPTDTVNASLTAEAEGGLYGIQTANRKWNPRLIHLLPILGRATPSAGADAGSPRIAGSPPISLAADGASGDEIEEPLLAPYPVHAKATAEGGGVYRLLLEARNPLATDSLIHLRQSLPGDAEILNSGGAVKVGNELVWDITLTGEGSATLEAVFKSLSVGAFTNWPAPVFSIYDGVQGSWLTFRGEVETLVLDERIPPSFKRTEWKPEGFLMWLYGRVGRVYLVEFSTDLKHWQPLGIWTNETGTVTIVVPPATNVPHRFFRAVAK